MQLPVGKNEDIIVLPRQKNNSVEKCSKQFVIVLKKSAPCMLESCISKRPDEVPKSYIVQCCNYHVNHAFVISCVHLQPSPQYAIVKIHCCCCFPYGSS